MFNSIRLILLVACLQMMVFGMSVQATSTIINLEDDIKNIENKPLIEKGESMVKTIGDIEEGVSILATSGSVKAALDNTSWGQSVRQCIANYQNMRSTILEYGPVPLNTITSICGGISAILLMRLPYMDPDSEEYRVITKVLQGITVTTTSISMIMHWFTQQHNKDLLRVQAEAEKHKETIETLKSQLDQK